MRISSISVSDAKFYQRNNVRKTNIQSTPNFKGNGGARGLTIGAVIGIGLTALSGGALAWTIPAIGGLAGIGGDIYEKNSKPSDNNDDDSYNNKAYYFNQGD